MLNFIKGLFKPKADLRKLVQEGALIIDVRTKGEYRTGHIAGSKNIPLDNIRMELTTLRNLKKPVITVCLSGNRSRIAKSILASAGLEVFNGGAWSNLKRQLQ